eukprot:6190959-Pleurochrysis_carterae.AAC.2
MNGCCSSCGQPNLCAIKATSHSIIPMPQSQSRRAKTSTNTSDISNTSSACKRARELVGWLLMRTSKRARKGLARYLLRAFSQKSGKERAEASAHARRIANVVVDDHAASESEEAESATRFCCFPTLCQHCFDESLC